jgi:hypothetical protein
VTEASGLMASSPRACGLLIGRGNVAEGCLDDKRKRRSKGCYSALTVGMSLDTPPSPPRPAQRVLMLLRSGILPGVAPARSVVPRRIRAPAVEGPGQPSGLQDRPSGIARTSDRRLS